MSELLSRTLPNPLRKKAIAFGTTIALALGYGGVQSKIHAEDIWKKVDALTGQTASDSMCDEHSSKPSAELACEARSYDILGGVALISALGAAGATVFYRRRKEELGDGPGPDPAF